MTESGCEHGFVVFEGFRENDGFYGALQIFQLDIGHSVPFFCGRNFETGYDAAEFDFSFLLHLPQ